MQTVDLRSFAGPGELEELGKGGEGQVFAIRRIQDKVYKEFLSAASTIPGRPALEHLIELRSKWSPEETQWLSMRTVWPEVVVLDGSRMRGFLMPKIAPQYFRRHGIRSNPKTVPCEWNLLSMRTRYRGNPNISTTVPEISNYDALVLVHDLAKTVAMLHRHDVIIGDMSGRNLLWTDTPKPHVLVIDCDSFRVSGSSGVASPKQSPDWDDPHLNGAATSQESDVYKLGLAAYRAVWAATTDRPDALKRDQMRRLDGIPAELSDLITRSVGPSDRPSADEWVRTLDRSVAFRGRPAVSMSGSANSGVDAARTPRPVATPAPAPKGAGTTIGSGPIRRPDRPVIKMPPVPRPSDSA
jgi:hypothetical protein